MSCNKDNRKDDEEIRENWFGRHIIHDVTKDIEKGGKTVLPFVGLGFVGNFFKKTFGVSFKWLQPAIIIACILVVLYGIIQVRRAFGSQQQIVYMDRS